MLDRERPTIFGDGEQTRDFVYVDDVVDALVRASDKGGGLIINIGTGVETSVQELYDSMARGHRLQASRRTTRRRAPASCSARALDPGRAEIHLGWKPWTDLDDGVEPHPRVVQGRAAATLTRWPALALAELRGARRAGPAGAGRPTYAGSGWPTSTSAWGSHSAGSASASRAASGQKIGAATQHDASPASAAASMRFSTAAPSDSSAMPHSARWRVSSG